MSNYCRIVNYGECKQPVCLLEHKKLRLVRKRNGCSGNKIIRARQKKFWPGFLRVRYVMLRGWDSEELLIMYISTHT